MDKIINMDGNKMVSMRVRNECTSDKIADFNPGTVFRLKFMFIYFLI